MIQYIYIQIVYIYIYVACLPWYTRATWLFLKHRHIRDVHTNGCLRMQCQVKIRCHHFVTTQCDRIKYSIEMSILLTHWSMAIMLNKTHDISWFSSHHMVLPSLAVVKVSRPSNHRPIRLVDTNGCNKKRRWSYYLGKGRISIISQKKLILKHHPQP